MDRTTQALAILKKQLEEIGQEMTDGLSEVSSAMEDVETKVEAHNDRLSRIEIKLDRALQLLALEWHGAAKVDDCVDRLAGRVCQCKCHE